MNVLRWSAKHSLLCSNHVYKILGWVTILIEICFEIFQYFSHTFISIQNTFYSHWICMWSMCSRTFKPKETALRLVDDLLHLLNHRHNYIYFYKVYKFIPWIQLYPYRSAHKSYAKSGSNCPTLSSPPSLFELNIFPLPQHLIISSSIYLSFIFFSVPYIQSSCCRPGPSFTSSVSHLNLSFSLPLLLLQINICWLACYSNNLLHPAGSTDTQRQSVCSHAQ